MQGNSVNIDGLKREFYEILNKQRTDFKKKAMQRYSLGELAVMDLLMSGITKQDQAFQQTIAGYQIVSVGSIDYMYYEHEQQPKGYQHSPDEVKNAYLKALDDMINGPYKAKLLMGLTHNHVSFGMIQEGTKGERFKIGAISMKANIILEGIVFCQNQQDSGFILGGKLNDVNKKPLMVVLNRGTQNQIVVGPSRISFIQERGEFRAQIPENIQGVSVSQIIYQNQEYNKVEVFLTFANDNSISYGQGQDLPINFNQFNNLELGFLDIISDLKDIRKVQAQMNIAFIQDNLFEGSSSASTNQRITPRVTSGQTSTQPGSVSQIRMTKTQLLRQQTAQQKQIQYGSNPQQQQQQQQMPVNSMNQNQTPHFNRSQTFTIGVNNNQPQPNFQTQPFKLNFNTNTQQMNENKNPNNQISFQFNSNINSNFNSTNSTFPKVNFGGNTNSNFNTGLNGFKNPFQINNNFNNTQQQNTFQVSQQSAFQNPNSTPKFQVQSQQRPQIQQNQNNFQPQQQINQQQQYPVTFKFNPPSQPTVVQPVLRFGTQSQSQMNQQIQQQQQQQCQQPQTSPLVFSQLSLIDQETLKGFLKEISALLSPDQIQKITALMLTDPIQFYKYYQAATDELSKSSSLGNLKNQDPLNLSKSNNHQQKQDDNQSKKMRDFDDLTLFLSQLSPEMIRYNEVKYQMGMQQVKEGLKDPKQLLEELIIRKKYPINESFRSLYQSKNNYDAILILGKEEFYCHQIVFASVSRYFKSKIKECKDINKYQNGLSESTPVKLICPDWMDLTALKQFILFMYTGKLNSAKSMDTTSLINLLRIANAFYIEYLQEYLISCIIIPNLAPVTAVKYLKECIDANPHYRESCLQAWKFLREYCYFYLQKHLPSLLRTNPAVFRELNIKVMRQIIDKSFIYLIDGNKDLEVILQFEADTWADKSITKLFLKSQSHFDSCSAFDHQIVPQFGEFLKSADPKLDYQCKLIKSEDTVKSELKSKQSHDSTSSQKPNDNLNSTFINGLQTDMNEGKADKDLSNWKPNANVIKHSVMLQDIFDKEPQFYTQINMDNLKQDFEANKGASIVSKAFDYGRRSWTLKVDIDYEYNVSVWVVERGKNLSFQDGEIQVGMSIPIKFSSILMSLELIDVAFGEYKSLMFYSYPHDANQIVGHKNFINLNQLKDRSTLTLKVHMKEFTLHSAMMHYINNNFSELYSKDLKTVELIRKNYTNSKNGFITNDNQNNIHYELLHLPFSSVYQLLSSNEIRVDDENSLLGFLFYYSRVQGMSYRTNDIVFIMDMLSQTLRFQYISTKKILSALRDNQYLRQSKTFVSQVSDEFNQRVQGSSTLILSGVNSSKSTTTKSLARKYYDMSKVSQHGRKKQEVDALSGKPKQAFVEDVMKWLQNSNHSKQDDSLIQREILRYKNLYYEEKSKVAALEQAHYHTQRQLSAQKKQNAEQGRRSRSIGRLYETQESLNYLQTNLPAFLKPKSPANKTPGFEQIVNNQHLIYDRRANPVTYHRNNSFDQSRYVQDHRRQLNDSIYFEQKVQANQNADFSQILRCLDSDQKQDKRYDHQSIPYYRRAMQKQSKMERQYNLQVIAGDLRQQFNHDFAASAMTKCTKNCFISLKENNLLPTEERCLRNCFIKSFEFQEYMENETRYTLRNQE